MLYLGQFNRLKLFEIRDVGADFLGDADEEVFLHHSMVKPEWKVGQEVSLFVYYDSEGRLTASTFGPTAQVGEFAALKVNAIEEVGAFLDWGLPKDLFLPFREQTREFRVGHYVVVYVYLDNTGRIAASMRVDKYVDLDPGDLREGQKVDLFIAGVTDLGYKAFINNRHVGVLYGNETFQELTHGDRRVGYIKRIREDGKIDLSLSPKGHHGTQDLGEQILELLAEEGGYLELNDTTSPEVIYQTFGVSKKKYKMALGGLLKKKLIVFEGSGIKIS